jgi:hypothetical protein
MALSFTGTLAANRTVTANVTALTATTAYVATTQTPQGHTATNRFTTDGAGAGTFQIVPQSAGTYQVSVAPAATAAAVTGSFYAGGHGAS